ncbi:sugar ABC transporter ATP-binding protein [Paracoccus onubensis]|uniref:Sugar ABC transporter ATP-binding protein n=2 Tax=Paracoccus onubensis TaxID=1675788 RepID=A0A418T8V2_9RHOB|nr:sugar ABC transporter ATP-binding protein [Paracoccus onubensis]
MVYLEAQKLGRDFPGVRALDEVSITLTLGRVHILAGENGAGKSTLVKLLTGSDTPSQGSIRIDGKDPWQHPEIFETISYVPQELTLFPHLSVAENLFMPFWRSGHGRRVIDRKGMERDAKEYLDRFAIEARPGDLVRQISVPDQQLLQIARASTNRNMKVLILDEPTSALTATEVERVFSVIRDFRKAGLAVIFISHKMDEIFEIGDDYTVLRNGREIETGQIGDCSESELIRAMSGKALKVDDDFRPRGTKTDRVPLLSVRELSGKRFENVSFDLFGGEILGFAGLVGSGRSEVMQTLFGFLRAKSGSAELEGRKWKLGDTSFSVAQGMLYLSEERKHHGILPLLSLRKNIGISILDRTAGRFGISARKESAEVAKVIRDYDIKTDSMGKRISLLSGGNQQKAIIGRAMATSPRVLIFDEPTKGIDVRTKAEIYRIMRDLAERGVAVILISSEMEELRKCASRIITMHAGTTTGEFQTENTTNETLVAAIFGKESASHEA